MKRRSSRSGPGFVPALVPARRALSWQSTDANGAIPLSDGRVRYETAGALDEAALRADAQRYHGIYGEYGISVFAARDATLDELAQQVPLVRFETLTLVRVGALRAAGFRLDPTGRNPRHFTVLFDLRPASPRRGDDQHHRFVVDLG